MMSYAIRHFTPADQETVAALITEGLGDHFDEVRPEYNPDLFDIQANYVAQGATFLVMESGAGIIACGALVKEHSSNTIARIVRVSVRHDHRGQGLGRVISERLIDAARTRGFHKILVETNSDWTPALTLYQSCGFTETHRAKPDDFDFVEVHMEMDLQK